MHTPNLCVLGLQIFTQHSQISLLHGVLIPFCDTCHTFDVSQVALNRDHDPARRLVECMFGLKIGVVSS